MTRLDPIGWSAIALVALVALVTPASAQAEGPATKFLQARHASVERILREPAQDAKDHTARDRKLNEALGRLLDFDELSRRALAAHWETLSAVQRSEFVSLLARLVERSYQRNLESTLDFAIRYTSEASEERGIVVRTVARSRKNRRAPEVSIDYTLASATDGFRVYDVTTDGVSLVENYRRQFDRIIKRDGWDALMERMRKKLADGDAL